MRGDKLTTTVNLIATVRHAMAVTFSDVALTYRWMRDADVDVDDADAAGDDADAEFTTDNVKGRHSDHGEMKASKTEPVMTEAASTDHREKQLEASILQLRKDLVSILACSSNNTE